MSARHFNAEKEVSLKKTPCTDILQCPQKDSESRAGSGDVADQLIGYGFATHSLCGITPITERHH